MPIWPGFYRGKKPSIRFQMTGTQGHPEEVIATVDTGFDGFLALSAAQAQPHALEPAGTTMATMANGARLPVNLAFANIGFSDRTVRSVANVFDEPCECLVGLDFLRRFQLALVITDQKIHLVTPAELDCVVGLHI